jgi:pSer/pThr/pTyr-binding forkhead associated (FHA) protein
MPLIRCPECGQAYNVPPAVAVRLPTSVANCTCGHWLCGSREGLLSRLSESGRIEEISLAEFRVDLPNVDRERDEVEDGSPTVPRNIRIIARTVEESIDAVFTIQTHPLWIGRKGCHINLDDAELSIQHCSIAVRGGSLIITDAASHTGTFLDGQQITEARIDDGTHLLRVGTALLCIEPVEIFGTPVEPPRTATEDLFDAPPRLRKKGPKKSDGDQRLVLRCIEGVAAGTEFEIPPEGGVVGREGSFKVGDEYLSRRHFSLAFDDTGVLRVRDLGSRNGTYLNTLPARNTKVRPGDEIKAGLSVFRLESRSR